MLEFAHRFWRRVRGHAGTETEDRRARRRRASGVVTAVRAKDGEVRLPARVLDVSPAGAGLAVPKALEPGAVIGVEVPGGTEQSSSVALACVVHVRPHGEGGWVLGCSFCQPLSEADYAAFGAREAPPEPDLRGCERFPCTVRASFELVGEKGGRREAGVLNVSLRGIGLRIGRPVPAGALLNLELESAAGGAHRTLLACVVHVTTHPDNEWILGCHFLHDLGEADLAALLER
jgi:hypothetical protein